MVLGVFISALTILPDIAKASTLYVGGAGPGNYTAIQAAIDDADPGDTVYVFNGTYDERVRINKTLSLIGEDRNSTTIQDMEYPSTVSIESPWVNISGFTVTGDTGGLGGSNGIWIFLAHNCTVSGNIIFNTTHGLRLNGADDSRVIDNVIVSSWTGVSIESASRVSILGNNMSQSKWEAIRFSSSSHATVTSNLMSDGGIRMQGDDLTHWDTHHIDTSNTVNGGPIYYWKGVSSGAIPVDAGQVILANCTGVSVENTDFHNVSYGIQLGFSSHNRIADIGGSDGGGLHFYESDENEIINNTLLSDASITLYYSDSNTVTGNRVVESYTALSLRFSDNNTVEDNDLSNNTGEGLYTYLSVNNTIARNRAMHNRDGLILQTYSDWNTIVGNVASDNEHRGIYLFASRNNTITSNTVANNGYHGIMLTRSNHTLVYHNNLVNNTEQAEDDLHTNLWDDGYPSGGNYWSDYNGTDNCSGPNQDNCPDPDGIGDTPYTIDVDSQDGYPLMEPLPLEIPSPGNQRPICEIVQPVEHERTHETYTITGTASDEDGSIVIVEISIDDGPWIQVNGTTSWSYEWDTMEVDNGEYTIHARCLDDDGAYDVASVHVDVHNPTEEETMYGEIFFWTAVMLVVIIALAGLGLEVRRRKKEEP